MAHENLAADNISRLHQQQRADSLHSDSVAEDDYQSFCAALNASARGRAFLEEYARRNRHADTDVVLAALDRLEEAARSQKAAPESERIKQDLRALLETLRSARPQIDYSPGAIKAATLTSLIDFAQARIEALVTLPDAPRGHGLLAQALLAEVPVSDQPELPIPQPVAQTPAFALVRPALPAVEAATPVKLDSAPAVTQAPRAQATTEAAAAAPSRANLFIPSVDFDYSKPADQPVKQSGAFVPPSFEAPSFEQATAEPQAPAKSLAADTYEIWNETPPPEPVMAAPQPIVKQYASDNLVGVAATTAIQALVAQLGQSEQQAAQDAVARQQTAAGKAPDVDALSGIMMLSDEERQALFS